jgi:hypothetical protein
MKRFHALAEKRPSLIVTWRQFNFGSAIINGCAEERATACERIADRFCASFNTLG